MGNFTETEEITSRLRFPEGNLKRFTKTDTFEQKTSSKYRNGLISAGPLGWTAAALRDRGTHSFRVKVVWAPRTAAHFLTQMELTKTIGINGVPVFLTTAGKRTRLYGTENVMTN